MKYTEENLPVGSILMHPSKKLYGIYPYKKKGSSQVVLDKVGEKTSLSNCPWNHKELVKQLSQEGYWKIHKIYKKPIPNYEIF